MAVELNVPRTCQEHEMELLKLSEFIKDTENMLEGFVKSLGGQTDEQKSTMYRCAHDSRHFVPETSLREHERVCQYVTMGMDHTDAKEFVAEIDSHFHKSNNNEIELDPNTLQAISVYARQQSSSHDSHLTQGAVSSLVDSTSPAEDFLQSLDPIGYIRFIKSWHLIPPSFSPLTPSSLHPVPTKAWMFNNIPDNHIYNNEIGGEMRLVEDVMSCIYATPTLTPDVLLERLRPLMSTGSARFVLSFWKFFNILKIQETHKIQNNVIAELLPLPVGGNQSQQAAPSVAMEIQMIATTGQTTPTNNDFPKIPVPSDHMTSHMTTEARKILYDYVIELSQQKVANSKDYLNDPDLFRDDVSMATSKKTDGDEDGNKSHLEVMKEMRDYRRRRQSYRAKNVHVTKKTTKQIFHDIIEARTREIQLSLGIPIEEGEEERGNESSRAGSIDDREIKNELKERKDSNDHRSSVRHRSRSPNRSSRSSRSDGRRNRSRDRSKSPGKRNKSPRKRSRSPKKRKRSRSRDRKHKKHKHKSKHC